MELNRIIDELKGEHARLTTAIDALEGRAVHIGRVDPRHLHAGRITKIVPFANKVREMPADRRDASSPGQKGKLTADGRRRLSLAMKRRWATKRAQG